MSKKTAAIIMLCIPLALAAANAPTPPQPDVGAPQSSNELQEKQQELTQVSQRIFAIEEQARVAEPVQEKMSELRETVTQEMVRQAPELEQHIARQNELVEELTVKKPAETEDSDQQEKLAEYQELRRKIEPIERQAQEAEKVVTARQTYIETLTEEMRKIDQQTDDLLARYRNLAEEINQMRARP